MGQILMSRPWTFIVFFYPFFWRETLIIHRVKVMLQEVFNIRKKELCLSCCCSTRKNLKPWAMGFVSLATMKSEVGVLGQE